MAPQLLQNGGITPFAIASSNFCLIAAFFASNACARLNSAAITAGSGGGYIAI
jgi:hypothetical protein